MLTTTFLLCALIRGQETEALESIDASSEDDTPTRRLPRPNLGAWGQGCRTGVPINYECNTGLRCQKHWHGSYWSGTCVSAPSQPTGGIGEPCNDTPFEPCNGDWLQPSYIGRGCTCEAVPPSPGPPQPVPPQPVPSDRGRQNQRCYSSGGCNQGLSAVTTWENQAGQALQYPVCRCQYNRVGAAGPESADDTESTDTGKLGMPAPQQGYENEPCLGNWCYGDLYCQIRHHGGYPGYTTGTCVRHEPSKGGDGEPCRDANDNGPVCDYNLHCTYVQMYPQGHTYMCQSGSHPSPPVPPAPTGSPGEAHGRCNNRGRPCNHSNLSPQWELIDSTTTVCICDYLLGSTGGDADDESPTLGDADDDDSRPTLGMPAPHLGREGEPCRNGETYPWTECDSGLYCRYWKRGQAFFGKCERWTDNRGGLGERCNDAPLSPCNGEWLRPSYGRQCTCIANNPAPSPIPVPPAPQPSNRGGANQRCYNNGECNVGCSAITNWEHQAGQAFEVPVCKCRSNLGVSNLGASVGPSNEDTDGSNVGFVPAPANDDDASPTLGMPAPHLGREGEPCRNGETYPWTECDSGLYCQHVQRGSATYGSCRRWANNRGGLDERCNDAPLSPCNGEWLRPVYGGRQCTCVENNQPIPVPPANRGGANERCYNDGSCDVGLSAVTNWEHQSGQAFEVPVCECRGFLGDNGAAAAPKGGD